MVNFNNFFVGCCDVLKDIKSEKGFFVGIDKGRIFRVKKLEKTSFYTNVFDNLRKLLVCSSEKSSDYGLNECKKRIKVLIRFKKDVHEYFNKHKKILPRYESSMQKIFNKTIADVTSSFNALDKQVDASIAKAVIHWQNLRLSFLDKDLKTMSKAELTEFNQIICNLCNNKQIQDYFIALDKKELLKQTLPLIFKQIHKQNIQITSIDHFLAFLEKIVGKHNVIKYFLNKNSASISTVFLHAIIGNKHWVSQHEKGIIAIIQQIREVIEQRNLKGDYVKKYLSVCQKFAEAKLLKFKVKKHEFNIDKTCLLHYFRSRYFQAIFSTEYNFVESQIKNPYIKLKDWSVKVTEPILSTLEGKSASHLFKRLSLEEYFQVFDRVVNFHFPKWGDFEQDFAISLTEAFRSGFYQFNQEVNGLRVSFSCPIKESFLNILFKTPLIKENTHDAVFESYQLEAYGDKDIEILISHFSELKTLTLPVKNNITENGWKAILASKTFEKVVFDMKEFSKDDDEKWQKTHKMIATLRKDLKLPFVEVSYINIK